MLTERKRKYYKPSEEKAVEKKLEKLVQRIRDSTVIVEGKRDMEALKRLGAGNVLQAAGRQDHHRRQGPGMDLPGDDAGYLAQYRGYD